jgi:DNA mismatch repair protein MutL
VDDRTHRIAASIACRAAIKVHHPLDTERMRSLLADLFSCETPTVCPHGRPTLLRLTHEDLERAFRRR